MKTVNYLSIFAFLLLIAFASKTLAWSPKLVWKNLQNKYEQVEDIKPIIVNEGDKPIFIVPSFYLARILRFNAQTNEWEERDPYLCGYAAARIIPIRLDSKRKISVDFYKDALLSQIQSQFMPPLEAQPIRKGKYKLKLYYGLNRSKIDLVSVSPEFEIIEYKPE